MIRLTAYIGNIIFERHDGAVVNAAKNSLEGGAGVDGAIHTAAGPDLLKACKAMPKFMGENPEGVRCPAGHAVLTDGFNLDVPHIIHTVAPIYKMDSRAAPSVLSACYANSLLLASKNDLPEISFPAIGTGIFGYPLEDATVVAVNTVLMYAADMDITVNFVCFDTANFLVYKRVIAAAKDNWCVAEVFK